MMLSKLIEQQMEEDMQKGYDYMFMGNSVAASQEWTKVWEAILLQIDEQRYEFIEQLDGDFNGQQSIYNWASDYECELSNASWEAIDFAQKRIDFCEGYIARVKDKNDYNALGMRGAIAESYSRLGQFEKSDALFMQYLSETPAWGMGWIQWSRLYMEDSYLTCIGKETPSEDKEKAISILERALLIENLEDRNQVLSVLRETYLSQGLLTEAKKVEVQLRQLINASKTITNEAKISRNSPCPCGSNKKFKKCCGSV